MPQGKVKWFNNAKGYGFIIANESESGLVDVDLFVHFSSIQMEGYKTLKAGQEVLFEVLPSGKGFHAINIVPIGEVGSPTGESVPGESTAGTSGRNPRDRDERAESWDLAEAHA